MSLTVLTDEEIRTLVESLSGPELDTFQKALKTTLHEYSTGIQSTDSIHQPERTVIRSKATGSSTLFMPSSGPGGHGVKVVTLSSADADPSLTPIKPTGSVTLFAPDGSPSGFLHAKTLTAFRTALASSIILSKRTTVRTIVVFGSGLQAYWHVRLALMLRGTTIKHVYFINRRFSDNAKHILKDLYAVPSAVKQQQGWETTQFSLLTPGYGEFARLQKEYLRAADAIYCCTPSTEDLFDHTILTNHEGRKKGRLIIAIGSYTPKMRELPTELLHQATRPSQHHTHYHKHATEGGVIIVDTLDGALKEAGEVIQAGLEPKHLVELGELAMIHRMVKEEEESLASQSSTDASEDARSSLERIDLSRAGSSMSTVFGSDSSTTGSRRSASKSPSRTNSSMSLFKNHRRSSSHGSFDRKKQSQEEHLAKWLHDGNVIYKSVGLGLMDLTVGQEIVKLANARGVGTHIPCFS